MAEAGEIGITVELDGRTIEATGLHRTWMCLADRVKFEKQFSTSTGGVVLAFSELYEEDDDGKRKLKDGADVSGLREEYLAFFTWCELRRRADDVPDYAEFIESVVSVDLDHGPAAADPTPAAKPTAS